MDWAKARLPQWEKYKYKILAEKTDANNELTLIIVACEALQSIEDAEQWYVTALRKLKPTSAVLRNLFCKQDEALRRWAQCPVRSKEEPSGTGDDATQRLALSLFQPREKGSARQSHGLAQRHT